ncbi:hypothetical protein ACET3Z_009003 [Daucus carota]
MVGFADIPIVGKFVEKVSEYTVDAVFRGLRYMFCYQTLVNDLNSEIEKLNIEKDKMSRKVGEENANGKTIEDFVSKWETHVEEIQKSAAQELSPSCSCIPRLPIPDPVTRFYIGRNAAKKAEAVTQLTNSGKEHLTGEIAYLREVIIMPNPDTTFEEFPSRKDTYQKLWNLLVNEDGPLIQGIYGMAGVGKTRMMEQFWEEAIKKKIFKKAVRVNVGNENKDKIKLQEQIAGLLDCKLESEVMERRASQLENSLRNGDKVLLILDDVWQEIHLDDIIGTPFVEGSSSKGSKILLTSREMDACLANKCEHPVEIKSLRPDEALYLFKNTVGPDTIEEVGDESLVKKVCDKCGELPLLICAVGKALKGKPHNSWNDAHNQLKMGKFEKIPGVPPKVYAGIKLSIDNLQDDDAKSCLFLCSFFPEDAVIDMKMLIQLATGSLRIPDVESRVLAMVHYLKASSLLLNSGQYNGTKVHDIIRDVARSIAFTDPKYAFLQVTCKSQDLPSNDNYRSRRFLRIDAETENVHFNEQLEFRDLHILWLQSNDHPQQFSGGFFRIFANLSCLMLQSVKDSLEQFSLQPLNNLRTLSLFECDIGKTDGKLFPKILESLYIYICNLPQPLDVANLKCLRKLEIDNQGPVLVMENVISTLSSLEELHISNGFIYSYQQYHLKPIVMEISKLTHLTSLHFQFYKEEGVDNICQGTNIFSNLDRYNIYVGEILYRDRLDRRQDWILPSTRLIKFVGDHSKPWEGLMVRAEEVVFDSSDEEVSSICRRACLKKLSILRCENLEHLASGIQPATWFSKLTNLEISWCRKMKYLFSSNTARSLVQLQELSVSECESMEAIIKNEGSSVGEPINFCKLKSLKIVAASARFYAENSVHPPAECRPFFDGMVAFPCLETLELDYLPNTSVIWGTDCCKDTLSSFCQLKYLKVSCCDKLEILIPHDVQHRLHNLENIVVSKCNGLTTLFAPSVPGHLKHLKGLSLELCEKIRNITEAGEQVITHGILFPELTDVYLHNAHELKSFWGDHGGKANTSRVRVTLPRLSSICLYHLSRLDSFFHNANYEFHMPVIQKVEVIDCGLSTLFTLSVFKNLEKLEMLFIEECKLLEDIIKDGDTLETGDKIITLNRVSRVRLLHLPKFKNIFYNGTYECYMPALKNLEIIDCEFSVLFTCSVFRKFQQLEKLLVSGCESLEHIVEEVGNEDIFEVNNKRITSSQLSSIELSYLTKLKGFGCTSNYVFDMPRLQNFKIIQCPKFSSLKTNTSLVRVSRDGCNEGDIQDLDDFIRQDHKRRSTIRENEEEEERQEIETES